MSNSTSPIFRQSMLFILKHEGSYVNNPDDPGGETKYGISKHSYPNLDIKHLSITTAYRIYLQDYWNRLNCSKMPPPIAMTVFCTSVNCGQHRSAMWLQESVMASGTKIKIDGIIGPKTIEAIQLCDPMHLCLLILHRRLSHYVCLGKKYPEFLRGWVGRTAELMREIAL